MKELLKSIRESNVLLKVIDGELKLYADDLSIDPELIERIRENKNELIRFLVANDQKNFEDSFQADIPVADQMNDYPLSSAQHRLWILSQLDEGNVAYNIPGTYVFEAGVQREALVKSFGRLLERHEILRTVFRKNDQGEVRQIIRKAEDYGFFIDYQDLRQKPHREIDELLSSDASRPFDLSEGPLLRACLYQLSDDRYLFSYVVHHLISDGWSMDVLIEELVTYYRHYTTGTPIEIPALRIQYKDYACWQRAELEEGAMESQKAYWLDRFQGEIPVLELLGDRVRPAIKAYEGQTVRRVLRDETGHALRNLGREAGSTLFMVLLTGVKALLYRYTGQEDLVIGTPVAGRDHIDLENQIGFYANTLALRTRFNGASSFEQLLAQVTETAVGAYSNQNYPFDALVEELGLERDLSRHPLFDVMVLMQEARPAGMALNQENGMSGIQLMEDEGIREGISRFDLSFSFVDTGSTIAVQLDYNVDIFDHTTAARLLRHLESILEAGCMTPATSVSELRLLSGEEYNQLTETFNQTAFEYDPSATIVSLFEDQARHNPFAVALECDGTTLSFQQLNDLANRLGRYLRNQYHLQPDELVGICMDRGIEMVVSMLGVLKSGAGYLPIDPTFPGSRRDFMVSDSGCKVLLDSELYNEFKSICLSIDGSDLPPSSKPGDLAYVMYTSGSTGTPKGVMIEHRNVVSFLQNLPMRFGLGPDLVIGAATNFTFDISVLEILGSLLTGMKIFLLRDTGPERLLQAIKNREISALQITPSRLGQLLEASSADSEILDRLKVLLIGGEALGKNNYQLLRRLSKVEVYNVYGPTETTIWSTCLNIRQSKSLSIGKPLLNEWVMVLDASGNLLPAGVAGEICIGGEGLGRGYLNRSELTKAKFIGHPFKKEERLYRTGDRGRWTSEGNLEFLGRTDDQVKIRGFRIEPGEIEFELSRYQGIEAAAVAVFKDQKGEQGLVAYIKGLESLNARELRRHLGRRLPHYMMPERFVLVEDLPLTTSGKLDRKALSTTHGIKMVSGVQFVAPRSVTERQLADIWADVLELQTGSIGIYDNFFELGGHSIRATRLAGQLHREFEVAIGLKDVFTHTDIESQANFIEKALKRTFERIPAARSKPHYPLSFAQRRLWILSQFEKSNSAYNMPGIYTFRGKLDRDALVHSFEKVLERHEILRTVFRKSDEGEIRQFVLDRKDLDFTVNWLDLTTEPDADLEELLNRDVTAPFDLSQGPLLRANCYRVSDEEYTFCYVMHHIICDGWSMDLLIAELMRFYHLYESGSVEAEAPLRIQYKDYAEWQQNELTGASLQKHRDFWLEQFSGELPVLDLGGDKSRPAVKTYRGDIVHRMLPRNLNRSLRHLSRRTGGSLYMLLLASVKALMYRYTGQEDIIIGTPMAGRDHVDLEEQVGFYTNTIALRTRFDGKDTFEELLDEVREVILNAFEHQVYPFDKLIDDLQLQRDMSRHPLFDIQVILQQDEAGVGQRQPMVEELEVHGYQGATIRQSVFDLVFSFAETPGGLGLSAPFNADVFSRSEVERMLEHVEGMLLAIVESPDQPICDLDYLSELEKEELINKLNYTPLEFTKPMTLIGLFEEQVRKMPGEVALVSGFKSLTYNCLHEESSQLAWYLVNECQVKPGDMIGLMADRTEEAVVGMLGIMKSGGVYVPIDPAYPRDRKSYIIEDTGLKVLLTQSAYLLSLDYFQGDIFALDVQLKDLAPTQKLSLPLIDAKQLAYVIYTSGSTGHPKGVAIEHAAAADSIQAQLPVFDLKPGTRCLQFTSLSFDVSVFEFFLALLSGATIYMIGEEDKKEPGRFRQFLEENRIQVASIPPSYVKALHIDSMKSLEKLITGGEAAVEEHVRRFTEKGGIYFNAYGPTESSLCTSIFKIDSFSLPATKSIPIGKPIAVTKVYILDEENGLRPRGSIGEICIGGSGLAREYLNSPKLTAQKFLENPFVPGEMIYRSGDLGRWNRDGLLEFKGRKDDQVKINGYRVEPGEIARTLLTHEAVESATVLVQNRTGPRAAKELVAYLVTRNSLDVSELRSFLGLSLPAYMVPATFVRIDHLPLTINGKVDKRALLQTDDALMMGVGEYEPPVSESEMTMVGIWEQLLNRSGIGVSDNFFDLGGDSIRILQMTARMKELLGVDIPVADIYKYTTIRDILEHAAVNREQLQEDQQKQAQDRSKVLQELYRLKEHIISGDMLADVENVEDIFPMSQIQKGMVYESLMGERNYVYHDQMVEVRSFEDFSLERFERSLERMVEKHAILRTSFNLADFGREVQIVHRDVPVNVYYQDLAELSYPEKERAIRQYLQDELEEPFDYSCAPLWRMKVFNLGNDQLAFVFQTHHSIIDGWSDASFKTELNNLFLQLKSDPQSRPAPLLASYKDYVIEEMIADKNPSTREFWRKELEDFRRLPLFGTMENHDSSAMRLNDGQFQRLEEVAQQMDATVKDVSLAAFLFTLNALDHDEDTLVGLVTNNRPAIPDGEKILGCFLNTLPLRVAVEFTDRWRDLTMKLRKKLANLHQYGKLSTFEISRLHNERVNGGNPFFDAIFNFVDFHVYNSAREESASLTAQAESPPALDLSGSGVTNTYLDFTVDTTGGVYKTALRLTRNLVSGFSASELLSLYYQVLSAISEDPDGLLSEMDPVTAAEQQRFMGEFNEPADVQPPTGTLVSLFEERVKEGPDRVAVIQGAQSVSYREVNERANRFARYLRKEFAVQPDDRIGICLDRGSAMIISLWAVLKSGGAYVPIDPSFPELRRNFMASDSQCKVVIDARLFSQIELEASGLNGENPGRVNRPVDLAYVMYTSGSTGEPKGVLVEQRSVVRLVRETNYVQFDEDDRLLSLSNFVFDGFTFDLYGALLNGAALVIPSADELLRPDLLNRLIEEFLVTAFFVPTALFNVLAETSELILSKVRQVVVGGERVSAKHIGKFRKMYPSIELINGYGPTENTTFSTWYKIPPIDFVDRTVPIGSPIANTRVYITYRDYARMCPIGVIGEICLAGAGLARGYLNRPRLTAEKFIEDPFVPGERMYRTGDLGRWLPDGTIEFIGRSDDQLKMRGFRIELGEIEHRLQERKEVNRALVLARKNDREEIELVAYLTGEHLPPGSDLHAYLSKHLPAYMIPNSFVPLEAFPLTANGKIDRKALPDPGLHSTVDPVGYIPPGNETEAKLVQVWSEILGIPEDRIGIQDDFFALGGHSLKAMQLFARIHKEFDVKVNLREMFVKATVEELSQHIARHQWAIGNGRRKEVAPDDGFVL